MAFYEEELEDEVNEGGKVLSPESGLVNAAASPTAQVGPSSTPAAKPSKSPFVGISDYVRLNQPGTQKLAQGISSTVNQLGDQARSAIRTGVDQFGEDVSQGTVGVNQGLIDKAKTKAETLSDQEKQEFQKMRDASYQGPSSLQETGYFNNISDYVNKAKSAGENLKSETGIQELAKSQQKSPYKSRGIAAFDAALLGADKGARGTLNQAKESVADIPEVLSQAEINAANAAKAAQAQAQSTSQAVQSQFGNNALQIALQKMLQDRAKKEQDKTKSTADELIKALSSGKKLSQSQASLLGLGKDFGNDPQSKILAGLVKPASNYIQRNDVFSGITPESVATKDEAARMAALNELMGSSAYNLDPSKAGSSNLSPVSFDFSAAQKDIASKDASEKKKAEAIKAQEQKANQEAIEKQIKLDSILKTSKPPAGVSPSVWADMLKKVVGL